MFGRNILLLLVAILFTYCYFASAAPAPDPAPQPHRPFYGGFLPYGGFYRSAPIIVSVVRPFPPPLLYGPGYYDGYY